MLFPNVISNDQSTENESELFGHLLLELFGDEKENEREKSLSLSSIVCIKKVSIF